MAALTPNARAFSIDSLLQDRKRNQSSLDNFWSQRQSTKVVTMPSNMVNPVVPISTDPKHSQNNFISTYSPAASFGEVANRNHSENDLLKLLLSNQATDQQSLSRYFMIKELETRGRVNDSTIYDMTHLINPKIGGKLAIPCDRPRLETSLPSHSTDMGSAERCAIAELNDDVVIKSTDGNALKRAEFQMKLSEGKDTCVCYSNGG